MQGWTSDCAASLALGGDETGRLVEDLAEALPIVSRLEPLVKSATEKIADPESRGLAERAHKMLQKDAGDGNAAENKILMTKDAMAIFKKPL